VARLPAQPRPGACGDQDRTFGAWRPDRRVGRGLSTITTNRTRYLSQPPTQHTRQPSMRSRLNLGIWMIPEPIPCGRGTEYYLPLAFRVATALRAAARLFRVRAAFLAAARRFRVCAAFCPGVNSSGTYSSISRGSSQLVCNCSAAPPCQLERWGAAWLRLRDHEVAMTWYFGKCRFVQTVMVVIARRAIRRQRVRSGTPPPGAHAWCTPAPLPRPAAYASSVSCDRNTPRTPRITDDRMTE
jgi:hypothetical protein